MCVRNPDRGPGRRRTFKFSQIKEKYGTLRVYWDGSLSSEATIQVEEAIALAEARSATCCEICEIYRYDVLGEAAPKRVVFGNVLQPDSNPDFKGPDGMAFGTDGRLYCAVYNQKNVTVLDRRGAVADRLVLDGPQPTNCAFALEGRKLRVTEVGKGQVEEIDMACDGLALHLPKFA
ncbi:hypothetical protein CI41S_67050 [Bradyrhizobium ivorense]|nr:hypothetical protein CI41S_67050 [Bradyrhizobium ivorense]